MGGDIVWPQINETSDEIGARRPAELVPCDVQHTAQRPVMVGLQLQGSVEIRQRQVPVAVSFSRSGRKVASISIELGFRDVTIDSGDGCSDRTL